MVFTGDGDDKTSKTAELLLLPTDDPAVVRGGFDLKSSGRYRLSLVGADGIAGNDEIGGGVTCVPDALPEAEFLEPDPVVVAPEDWKVPVVVAAQDDVAVGRVVLYRGVNGWGPTPQALALETVGPTYATARCEFDLPALGARAGDVITYFASVYDNYPGSKHFTDTPIYIIRVISEEEYVQMARTKYRVEQVTAELEEFRRRMDEIENLRKELVAELEPLEKKIGEAGGKVSDADRAKLDEIAAKQRRYARRMKELADEMRKRADQKQIYEFEEAYAESLRKMADTLDRQEQETGGLTGSYDRMKQRGMTPAEAKKYVDDSLAQLRGAEKQVADTSGQIELTDKQMEQLRRADELMALTEQVVAITRQQRELAERMAQFRNKELLSPAEQIRARRMSQEQEELREELDDLLGRMESKAEESRQILPKMSASVLKIAGDIRAMRVMGDQQNAAALAQAGHGRYAYRAADSAATKLESLIKDCGGGGMAAACDDLDRTLRLTRMQITKSLEQLSLGRGVPGFSGGGSGEGYYGSSAKMSLMGPHRPGGQADSGGGAGQRGRGMQRGKNDPRQKPSQPETLAPDADTARTTDVRSMPGVPARYRGLAEQYFRRLADESK